MEGCLCLGDDEERKRYTKTNCFNTTLILKEAFNFKFAETDHGFNSEVRSLNVLTTFEIAPCHP